LANKAPICSIGDVLDAFMAFMVVHTCGQIEGGLPQAVKARMYFNVMLDFGIGLVPFLGDVADAIFRANTRNAAILEEHLREKGKKNLRQSGLPIPAVDPSDPAEFDRLHHTDSPPEYTSNAPSAHGAMTTNPQKAPKSTPARNGNGASGSHTPAPGAPAPAKIKDESRSGRSFFGLGGRPKAHDVEMGRVDEAHQSAPTTLQKQQQRRKP
jgi:hypothetical protein